MGTDWHEDCQQCEAVMVCSRRIDNGYHGCLEFHVKIGKKFKARPSCTSLCASGRSGICYSSLMLEKPCLESCVNWKPKDWE